MRYHQDGEDFWHCDGCQVILKNPELQETNCRDHPVHPMPKGWESQTIDFALTSVRPGESEELPSRTAVIRFVYCSTQCPGLGRAVSTVQRFMDSMNGDVDMDGLLRRPKESGKS